MKRLGLIFALEVVAAFFLSAALSFAVYEIMASSLVDQLPAIITAFATLVTSLGGFVVLLIKMKDLHRDVNSRLTELIASAQAKGAAEGFSLGVEKQRQRSKEDQAGQKKIDSESQKEPDRVEDRRGEKP